jgi:hypothetical protein
MARDDTTFQGLLSFDKIMSDHFAFTVIPAKAGIQYFERDWMPVIPAKAGTARA